ncbi:glycerophosphodiester phosphodiesterase 1 [Fopius arisanus]|uniref:Glycerophosphodiester phosphodiesterase 1 n=1 Tax=Fopius arisanus TaxID=64838 RepID=A0A9R1TJ82_9HYME|nr:PREDICTED: glycerophosphodiester phosphodiesterase 1 [Fopius arisanus]
MSFINLILNSALLWMYTETTWYVIITTILYFSLPWLFWGTLGILVALWFIKNQPVDEKTVNQVLGVDPFNCEDGPGHGGEYCMRVVAHRGGGYDYPENSLSAFRNSKEKGCSAVEFDLAFTKDHIPIIFHDETVERLTGRPGVVKEMTWDELNKLDISFNHPLKEKFNGGERIALFSDTIEQCLSHDLRVFIDIKETSLDIVPVVLDAYQRHPELYKKAVVTSFHPLVIYMIRRRDPNVMGSLSYRPKIFSTISYEGLTDSGPPRYSNPIRHSVARLLDTLNDWALTRFTHYVIGISVILLHKDIISPRTIGEWRNRGIRVIAWSVNLPSEKLHFSKILKIAYLTDTLLAERLP